MLQECQCSPYTGSVGTDERARIDTAYRIVADHMRMMTIAISDGLVPSRRESGSVNNRCSLNADCLPRVCTSVTTKTMCPALLR